MPTLEPEDVRRIREALADGESRKTVARRYGIPLLLLGWIRDGSAYANCGGPDLKTIQVGEHAPNTGKRRGGRRARKLNCAQARAIRAALLRGESANSLAKHYGVNQNVIRQIRDWVTYRDCGR